MQHSLAGEEACCLDVFFPYLADLHVDKVEDLGDAVLITARSRAPEGACHRCELFSARVSSRYRRRLHDLAAGGRPVMIDLEVRRFFCGNPECELRTFAEQVPAVALRHQRRTPLLGSVLEAVALALAGRAGARLASALGIEVSRTTLIRLIRALPDPGIGQVTVLGVDDFGKRQLSISEVLFTHDLGKQRHVPPAPGNVTLPRTRVALHTPPGETAPRPGCLGNDRFRTRGQVSSADAAGSRSCPVSEVEAVSAGGVPGGRGPSPGSARPTSASSGRSQIQQARWADDH